MTTTPPVTFSFATWTALFPEFTPVGATLGQAYFTIATATIIANSTTNPANGDGNLSFLVYLATSHVAWLRSPKDANGNPAATGAPQPAQLVGRISSASEGSVSTSLDFPIGADAAAQEKYLAQTQYGVLLWAALAPYRTVRYLARPTIVRNGFFPRFPWGLGR